MWYGLCGMCLVPIRKLKNNHILTIFILLFSFSYYLSNYKLGTYLFDTGGGRYSIESSLRDIIIYPNAVIDYLRIALNSGLFGTLSLFVLGYYLARVGIIENLKTKTTIQVVIFFWAAYTFLTYITIYHFNHIRFLYKLNNYMATFAYSSTIIYVYYNNSFLLPFLQKLEPYGRMGLTNYSMQGIVGVLLMGSYGLKLCQGSLLTALVIFIIFFIIQAIISFYWLKKYRYGPMEYIWRLCTERKFIPLNKN